jgi:hypothetical protein
MRAGSAGRRGPVVSSGPEGVSPALRGGAVRGRTRRASRAIGGAFRAHRWIVALAVLYVLVGSAAAAYYGFYLAHAPRLYMNLFIANTDSLIAMMAAVAVLVAVPYAIYVMVAVRPERPIMTIIRELRPLVTLERVAAAAPILLIYPFFTSTFTSLKAAIPHINPYSWDAPLSAFSQAVHGGYLPWQLLQPVFGHPLVTRALDIVYVSWFVVLYGVLMWQIFSQRDERLRSQFIASFMLAWIVLGTLGATLLSSAGPCYYGLVTGLPDPYAPLMDYLREVSQTYNLFALQAQDYLWTGYQQRQTGFGDGISAMPSMHLSMATLFALVAWRSSRRLGAVFTVYAILIFVGSIELGWHYAADGYVAILGTSLIWQIVGRLQRRGVRSGVGLVTGEA